MLHARMDEVIQAAQQALMTADEAIVNVYGYDDEGVAKHTTVIYVHVEESGLIVGTTLTGSKAKLGHRVV